MTAPSTARDSKDVAVALRRQMHRFTSLLRARALLYASEHPGTVERTDDWPMREAGDLPWRDATVAEFIRSHRAELMETLDDAYGHGSELVAPTQEHLRKISTVEQIWELRDRLTELCAEIGGGPEWWQEVRISP
jgi:hypothetical protein